MWLGLWAAKRFSQGVGALVERTCAPSAWPAGAVPQVVCFQVAWACFTKGSAGTGKGKVYSSNFVSPPGKGSRRTRRIYKRRGKYLRDAKEIFMGKYKAFKEDTCSGGRHGDDYSSSRQARVTAKFDVGDDDEGDRLHVMRMM